MYTKTLHQSFAIDEAGQMVVVGDVARGKACQCRCAACDGPLVARQGDLRAWHFAHTTGAACPGAAETHLHLAAKQVLLTESRVYLPSVDVRHRCELPDGRVGEAHVNHAGGIAALENVQLELPVDDLRIDVHAITNDVPLAIELAVTHVTGPEKSKVLKDLDLGTLEIVLEAARYEEWTWDLLAKDVIEDPLNRHWIHPIRYPAIESRVRAAAQQAAEGQPRDILLRYRVCPIKIQQRNGTFLTVWFPYNRVIYEFIRTLSGRYCGYWSSKYKNWCFPIECFDAIQTELNEFCENPGKLESKAAGN